MATQYVVFQKHEPYLLYRGCYISVAYWYAALEGQEAILLGIVNVIPGNSNEPITYEEARHLADQLN